VIQNFKDLISTLAEKAARQCGVEIYSSAIQFRKRSVKIDVRIDNGSVVSHNDCADYSRVFAQILDDETELEDYTLEISSPGLNRKLVTHDDFKRFIGSPVKISYGDDTRTDTVKGKLIKAEVDKLYVESQKKKIEIDFESIKTAKLDY
jgi:ribosome maturation factor RimP